MGLMKGINPNLVQYLFYGTIAVAIAVKIYKLLKMKKINNPSFKVLQIKYFICYFSFMAGFVFQGPYIHQLYHETGMSQAQISDIMSTFNIVAAFWGFLVGHVCDLLGHKKLIVLSSITLASHAACRFIGGYQYYIIASILLGVSTASNKIVFEDWLAEQIEVNKLPKEAQAIVKENSALINIFLNIGSAYLSRRVVDSFGIKGPFIISTVLFLCAAIVISGIMPSISESKKKRTSFLISIKSVKSSITNASILFVIILDVCYTFTNMIYTPRWTSYLKVVQNEKIPLSMISTTASVSAMNGAQLCTLIVSLVDDESTILAPAFALLSVFIAGMDMSYKNKNAVFISYILMTTTDGFINSGMWVLRKAYPREASKHIMGALKVVQSLLIALALQLMKGVENYMFLRVGWILASICTVFAIVLIFKRRISNENTQKIN